MDIAVEKFLTKIKDREGDRTATYDLPIGLFVLLPWVATRHRMQRERGLWASWSWPLCVRGGTKNMDQSINVFLTYSITCLSLYSLNMLRFCNFVFGSVQYMKTQVDIKSYFKHLFKFHILCENISILRIIVNFELNLL